MAGPHNGGFLSMCRGGIVQITLMKDPRAGRARLWGGSSMKDLVFEVILIVSLVVPVIATSMHPIKAIDVNRIDLLKKLRRRA